MTSLDGHKANVYKRFNDLWIQWQGIKKWRPINNDLFVDNVYASKRNNSS